MDVRVRACGLLTNGKGQILLVVDKLSDGSGYWWGPPGGGMEASDHCLVDCVKREFLEETGLRVDVGSLAYVSEYVDKAADIHHVELFFEVHSPLGVLHELDQDSPPIGGDVRRYARWMTKADMNQKTVYPEILKDEFWNRRNRVETRAEYIGICQGQQYEIHQHTN